MILTSTGELGTATRNDLLYEFRLNYQTDRWGNVVEWLFQLARHWSQWQDERIGTFPLEYRDPSGPVARERAAESGEDSTFYSIDDIIRAEVESLGARTWDDDEGEWGWIGDLRIGDVIQDRIVHATRVLIRLKQLLEAAGLDY